MKSIHLDMVRVTEAAAIAASSQVGRGDKITADKAATEAMRTRLNRIENFAGQIVIGEGKKDDAPGLFIGERLGKSHHLFTDEAYYDIAVDPIEGTTPTSKGGYEAMSVIALAEHNCFFSSEVFYMQKLAVGPHLASYDLSLQMPLTVLIECVSRATGKSRDQVTFCVLDRPRHQELINEIRSFKCRIRLIQDCDVSGAIATCVPDSGIDVYIGVGGSPEGVISAAALKCMRGYFEGRLCDKDGNPIDDKIYRMEDLAKGDVAFCATGITDGSLLRGVRYPDGKAKTHSVLMRSESGTVRWIEAFHGN